VVAAGDERGEPVSPRVLVLGGEGMLGHKMFQILRERFDNVLCTLWGHPSDKTFERVELLQRDTVIPGVDASDFSLLSKLLADLRPTKVVNCIGIVKQRREAHDAIPSITLNALLPHQLAKMAAGIGARLIHFSTDCVFTGSRGGYREEDPSDADDLYGRTKYLGEVSDPPALTLRTSIIGRELTNHASLLEWFLAQNGRSIKGFRKVLYSGLTTNRMAHLIGDLIEDHPDLHGLYQVAGPWISKHDLLCLAREAFGLDIEIVPDDEQVNDRTMCADRFFAATGYRTPSWPEMLAEVAADPTPYQSWAG
jgi:dTDP-4-dehydrorhamnose reductase